MSFKLRAAGRHSHTSRTPVKSGLKAEQVRQDGRLQFRNLEKQRTNYSEGLYTETGVKSNIQQAPIEQTQNESDRTGPKSEIEGGLFVFGTIKDVAIKFLVDTGASVCVLSKKIFDQLPEDVQGKLEPRNYPVQSAGGASLPNYGEISLDVSIDSQVNTCKFTVAEVVDDGILGLPFLNQTNSKIDFGNRVFTIDNQNVDCFDRDGKSFSQTIRCAKTITVPGRCQLIIGARVSKANKGK